MDVLVGDSEGWMGRSGRGEEVEESIIQGLTAEEDNTLKGGKKKMEERGVGIRKGGRKEIKMDKGGEEGRKDGRKKGTVEKMP